MGLVESLRRRVKGHPVQGYFSPIDQGRLLEERINQAGSVVVGVVEGEVIRIPIGDLSPTTVESLRKEARATSPFQPNPWENSSREEYLLWLMWWAVYSRIETGRVIHKNYPYQLSFEEFKEEKPCLWELPNGAYGVFFPPDNQLYPLQPGSVCDLMADEEFHPERYPSVINLRK